MEGSSAYRILEDVSVLLESIDVLCQRRSSRTTASADSPQQASHICDQIHLWCLKKGVTSAESSRSVRGLGKGGPGASGRVLPPVTGRSRVRVAVSSHYTGKGKANFQLFPSSSNSKPIFIYVNSMYSQFQFPSTD